MTTVNRYIHYLLELAFTCAIVRFYSHTAHFHISIHLAAKDYNLSVDSTPAADASTSAKKCSTAGSHSSMEKFPSICCQLERQKAVLWQLCFIVLHNTTWRWPK